MRHLLFRTAVAILLVAAGSWGAAARAQTGTSAPRRMLVVVSAANPMDRLAPVRVRRIFLREVTVWNNGWPITVYERPTEHPIREAFSAAALGKTPGQLSEYWLGLALTRGLEPPKVCRTSALLRQYLDRVKGGIGYVWEDELEAGMLEVARVVPKDRP